MFPSTIRPSIAGCSNIVPNSKRRSTTTSGWCLSAGAWMRPTTVYPGNGGIYRTVEKHSYIIDSLLTSH